jgi:hypothetical protein
VEVGPAGLPLAEHSSIVLLVDRKDPILPYPGQELVPVTDAQRLTEGPLVVPRLEAGEIGRLGGKAKAVGGARPRL